MTLNLKNSPLLYSVVDLETTGGMAKRDKITEIAIVVTDGMNIIDSYQTLINPQRSIPYEITRITGITDEMVGNAPKFYEVARKIVEMTEGTIFVAHNVRFDYSFLREEFAALGYTYTRKQLCTVVLSRKSFPGLTSYSLGNLIKHFKIKVDHRHRAMDDTLATVNILQRILSTEEGVFRTHSFIKEGIVASHLPASISQDFINSLPEITGVYYFHNAYGTIIYIGKSINIKKRVLQHFGNIDGKTDKFIHKVKDITFNETGSELIAMLVESHEIKTKAPEINKAQRAREYPYFVYTFQDADGYIRFDWDKTNTKTTHGKNILNYFSSKSAARSQLYAITENFEMCGCLTGLNDTTSACFHYQTGRCSKSQFEENTDEYNSRAELALLYLKKSFDRDFLIITEGRNESEYGVVFICDGHYRGYGFVDTSVPYTDKESITDHIIPQLSTPEADRLISLWLSKDVKYKIINIETKA